MMMNNQMVEFPVYEYTYIVEQLLFEQGTMIVKFVPNNTSLTAISYNIPILPGIDPTGLKLYLDNWAPNDKWFAQETILNSGTAILGAQT